MEIGDSMRQFLVTLGIQTIGGCRDGYTVLKRQMEALAACRMTLGMYADGRAVTVHAEPIKRFEHGSNRRGNSDRCGRACSNCHKTFSIRSRSTLSRLIIAGCKSSNFRLSHSTSTHGWRTIRRCGDQQVPSIRTEQQKV